MSFFAALDLDEVVRAQVVSACAAPRAAQPAKWLLPERLHLTVVFLAGLVDPAALRGRFDALAARTAPFPLALAGAGTFVTARAPSVLWLGVAPSPALAALRQDALASLVDAAGLDPLGAAADYTPHVTLARAKAAGALDTARASLGSFRSDPFWADHLTLYESRGTEYRAVFHARFAGSSAAGRGGAASLPRSWPAASGRTR